MITNTEQGKRLSGFFLGKVLKHGDYGQCKIYIPGIYPESYANSPDNLPDAKQVAPMFGGSLKGNGVFSYPNIDSTVICGFLNEDQNQPIYWGAIQGGDDVVAEQYAEARCEVSEESVKSGDDARVHKISVDKATIKMFESGHIEIKVFNDRKFRTGKEVPEIGCQVDIDENGSIIINASKQLKIKSPEIIIDTENLNLKSQTIGIFAGEQIEIKSDKFLNIISKDKIDVETRTEIHSNDAHYVQAKGQIGLTAEYAKMQGKHHPPIFI